MSHETPELIAGVATGGGHRVDVAQQIEDDRLPSDDTSTVIQVPSSTSIATSWCGPGGLLTSHFGLSSALASASFSAFFSFSAWMPSPSAGAADAATWRGEGSAEPTAGPCA